jgi:tRNA/rRNA methyltransferase
MDRAVTADGALGAFRIVLSRPSHPGNVGAAARAMRTMGIANLRLVAPRRFPDPEATALAAGAGAVLDRAVVCASLDEALAGTVLAAGFTARDRELSHPVRVLREAAPELLHAARDGPVALVFGNETSGLSNDELGRCRLRVTIPSDPGYGSLNLAAAVQVACYELASAAAAFATPEPRAYEPATAEDLEALFTHWQAAMEASGYLDPARPGRLMERLRRLLARAAPERSEVKALRGMLEAFERRMRR